MIGLPSIVMSMTPAQWRMMRSRLKHGKAVTAAGRHMLDHRQIAALRIGVVAVEIAAHDDLALVGLADVEMPGAERHDGVEDAA